MFRLTTQKACKAVNRLPPIRDAVKMHRQRIFSPIGVKDEIYGSLYIMIAKKWEARYMSF